MKASRTPHKRPIAWLMGALGLAVVPSSHVYAADRPKGLTAEPIPSPSAPIEERARLEPILTALVQEHLAREDRLPGQQPIVNPRVWYNQEGDTLNIDLGRAYLPTHYTITFEERLNVITSILYEAAQPTPIYRLKVWFDGKDIFEYFPEEKGYEEAIVPRRSRRSKRSAGGGKVLISPGHGIYFNSKYKDWRAQRDSSNFVVEDFITPVFARHLSGYLHDRSHAEVFLSRSTKAAAHPESGRPWLSMAARYYIKHELPEHTPIWKSIGQKPSAEGLEERDQDIRSRPLYANHLGVDAAIHLHTNAHTDRTTRGIRVFHHPKDPESKRLGDLALCYMKESLGTNSSFAGFPISGKSREDNHGENRLAHMPSIIAELGFHTNKDDANAILNNVFQDLAMRGLEKAYRMFRAGHGCEQFSATYNDVTVISDSTATASVAFGGFPRFPVRYESTVAECPSGVMCRPIVGRFRDALQPLTITHSCLTSEPFTIKWNVYFIDADKVRAETTATMHCQPKVS